MPLAVMALAFAGCRNTNKNVEQTLVPEIVTDTTPEIIPQEVISTIDFNAMDIDTMSNFKGGEGDIYMKMLIYWAFAFIDMIISAVLMYMGMMMLPPTMISLPFKVLIFIYVGGYSKITEILFNSVTIP